MFRRFIIVCWVLFALASIVGLVGGVGYLHYQGELEGFTELSVESGENRYAVLERIHLRKEGFGSTGILGALAAGLILLWNIILHTGHWIWMGRKIG